VIPYLDKHTYLIALLGILFYYGIQVHQPSKKKPWLLLSGYFLFNFLVGVSLSDSNNPEIQPITLYTIAIGMHYFVRDHLTGVSTNRSTLAALIFALVTGYFVGYFTHIPDAATAIGVSFVAGGMILNVLHYELPKQERKGYIWFVIGSLFYTSLLLFLEELKF
jgi:uncharacterized membrane protein AbrB (regulator of aidB expression)